MLPLSVRLARTWRSINGISICQRCIKPQRRTVTAAATQAADDPTVDLVESSSFDISVPANDTLANYDPLRSSRQRKRQLPSSRYQFRPPRYDRGPLHPHQSPAVTDPASREFVPGPFSSPTLEQQYHANIAADYMTMCYQHVPPGFRPPEKGPRLRPWLGDSPYYKNRDLRGPRGGDVLRLLRKPITFRNIPMIERVTVHAYCKGAAKGGSQFIHVAGMVLQAITNHRIRTHVAKQSEAQWSVRAGMTISMTVDLKGEDMYHFLAKLVNVVLPRIKDWRGIRATTGDNSGNLSFGVTPEVTGTFPEIEFNYDSYPSKMIPGLYFTIHTTATCDKDARLLLQTVGIPFYGKIVD